MSKYREQVVKLVVANRLDRHTSSQASDIPVVSTIATKYTGMLLKLIMFHLDQCSNILETTDKYNNCSKWNITSLYECKFTVFFLFFF